VFFYGLLKLPLIRRKRCRIFFKERVATFDFRRLYLLLELQPGIIFLPALSVFQEYSTRFWGIRISFYLKLKREPSAFVAASYEVIYSGFLIN